MADIIGIGIRDVPDGRSQRHLDASSERRTPASGLPIAHRPWAGLTLGERAIVTAWRAVAAHLAAAAAASAPNPMTEQQVAPGGAGVYDGVMDDALPPALRKRAG